jgi:hypothetical protein
MAAIKGAAMTRKFDNISEGPGTWAEVFAALDAANIQRPSCPRQSVTADPVRNGTTLIPTTPDATPATMEQVNELSDELP